MEEQAQLVRRGIHVQRTDSGIRTSGSEQCRFPAHQRGQPAQGVHEPVGQNIRPWFGQKVSIILKSQGIFFSYRLRLLIIQSRQGGTAGAFVQPDAPQAVQNPPVGAKQIEVAGAAHQLGHQLFLHRKAHFIGAVEGKCGCPLHGRLGDFRQLCPQKMLTQEHTEHGRLRRVLRRGRGQVQPGGGGIGGEEQLLPAFPAPKMQNQGVPAGLVNFVHPGAQAFLPYFLQNGS